MYENFTFFTEEKDTSTDDEQEEQDETVESQSSGKTGLADVLAKILHKNVPSHKQVKLKSCVNIKCSFSTF
jgi:hypothetical protein